jgi:hypothetical protein
MSMAPSKMERQANAQLGLYMEMPYPIRAEDGPGRARVRRLKDVETFIILLSEVPSSEIKRY